MSADEIVKIETHKIERFVALGFGRYEAIQAVEAGIDWQTVESRRTVMSPRSRGDGAS
jgi:hypothetical protein